MKSILRNLSATLGVAGLFIISGITAGAQTVTLASLLAGGSITSGNLVFSDFSFSQTGSLTVNPANIVLSSTLAGIQLQSTSSYLSGINKTYSMSLSFDVTANNGLAIVGNGLSVTGEDATKKGSDSDVQTISTTDKKTSLASELVYINSPTTTSHDKLNDSAVFAAQSQIVVNQNFTMTTGGGSFKNAVYVNSFNESFTTTKLVPVPEPATMALVAMGGAGLLLFRRRN
jgi:hypothetical protein